MKPLHVLPPAAALIASGIWIGVQRQSVASLREETDVLRERIVAAREAHERQPGGTTAAGSTRKTPSEKFDDMSWEEVAAAFEDAGGLDGGPDMRLMMALQRRLMAMDADELLAALDEVEALDLSADARMQLVGALMDLLGHKEPEMLLERYARELSSPEMGPFSWRLANAFQSFVTKDATAAEAWIDRQVAAGTFVSRSLDGKHTTRALFEARMISHFLKDDPAGAERRLEKLPEAQRAEALQHAVPHPLRDEQVGTIVRLTREFVPPDQARQPLEQIASRLIDEHGLGRVEHAVADMQADPQAAGELAAAAARHQLQRNNENETLDSMREWLGEHAPAEVDRFTGEALGSPAGRGRTFEQASELAIRYHEESGSDEVLAAFLRGRMARNHPGQSIELIDRIVDDDLRESLRADFERRAGR